MVEAKGFDAFELRLGDLMRGERATMGKSLLDVQRELRIKATYVAAIENCDPTAFDTPGFIAGYVRSYARYLGMDPDKAFEAFCAESGFETAHGMSSSASSVRPKRAVSRHADGDQFASPNTPFVPATEALLSRIEPGAIGSAAVLLTLIAGLGYGAWTVFQEVQRVQLAPVEEIPTAAARIDPLAGGSVSAGADASGDDIAGFANLGADASGRLYRPQALDVPVMVPRDGPIAALDPGLSGTLPAPTAPAAPTLNVAEAPAAPAPAPSGVQVTDAPAPEVVLFAVRPSWVRVRAADGTVIFEKILDSGEEYILPATEEPPTLRAGNSGSLYFLVNGTAYGPAGPGATTASNVVLSANALLGDYTVADLSSDPDLAEIVNYAEVGGGSN